jgi:hypothetical protein
VKVRLRLGTKSSLGLDQCKLATLYTVMMYVASCTVQCTVQCTATFQAPSHEFRALQKHYYQSITSLIDQKQSQTEREASKKQKVSIWGPQVHSEALSYSRVRQSVKVQFGNTLQQAAFHSFCVSLGIL